MHRHRGYRTTSTYCTLFMLAMLFGRVTVPQLAYAAVSAELEGPTENQQVAGISIIRGWAFSDTSGVTINQVTLAIDGNEITPIPCCSVRGDVAQAFPQFPATNTTNSGFGITLNYGILSPGPHVIGVTIRDSSGAQQAFTRNITVVRPGDSTFLDLVDLSAASAQRQGQEVLVAGIRIRGKGSQQVVRIDSRLRWFQNLQGLGIVETTTRGAASITGVSPLAREAREQTGAETSGLQATLESPSNGQGASGIAVIRGWAFSNTGRSIRRVQLFVDGAAGPTIPCCSPRGDVATVFPNQPNALNSGFGITFNYGLLPAGVHTITVEIEDSAGAKKTFTRGVLVKRPGEFSFLQDLDLSNASVRIANGTLVIDGAIAKDRASGQTTTRTLRYRFDLNAQGFNLVEDYNEEILVQNFSCDSNGNTANIAALKQTPGADGISLPEAITAVNNTIAPTNALITFSQAGTLTSCTLPSITRGNLTMDGDVNSDGIPDVTLTTTRITIAASNSIVQGFRLTGTDVQSGIFTPNGVRVRLLPSSSNVSLAHVAILANSFDGFIGQDEEGYSAAVEIVGGLQGTQGNKLSHILVSSNQINKSTIGITVAAGLSTSTQNIAQAIIVDNTITDCGEGILFSSTKSLQRIEEGKNGNITTGGIYNNRIQKTSYPIQAGPGNGVQDTVDVTIANNMVETGEFSGLAGIAISGGFGPVGASGNLVMTVIQGNTVLHGQRGISVEGTNKGPEATTASMIDAVVTDNATSFSQLSGISAGTFAGGTNDILMVKIQKNIVQSINLTDYPDSSGVAIQGGGYDNKMVVDATVEENSIHSQRTGVSFVGATRGSEKFVTGAIANNQVSSAGPGLTISGGIRASANTVDVSVSANVIENASGAGIEVQGGSAPATGELTGPARNNTVTGILRHNQIQQVQGPMISVVGGTNPVTGEVTGNLARQTIIGTLANNVRCEDGLAGNRAECTFAANFETTTALSTSGQQPEEKRTVPTPLPQALVQQLQERQGLIESRIEELQARAAEIPDDQLRQRFLKTRERLEVLRDKLTRRMAGQSEAVHAP